METRTLRNKLTKWPVDVLYTYSMAKVPEKISGYPRHKDKAAQVQWMLETFESHCLTDLLVTFGDMFNPLIRDLLVVGFSDSDLYQFLYDTPQFHSVALGLGSVRSKLEYINALIEHADQHPEKWDLAFDWMRNTNPNRYTSILLDWS